MLSSEGQRSVFMIAYYYPPFGGIGIRRVCAFRKYLPRSGFCSSVLTTNKYGNLPTDADEGVFRTGELFSQARKLPFARRKPAPGATHPVINQNHPLVKALNLFLMPDPQIRWYMHAVRRGRQLLHEQPAQILFSSSPPETNHLVALRLKELTGLPWVADFRDGWMFEPPQRHRFQLALRHGFESRMEQRVVHAADHIVAVNTTLADNFARRYPAVGERISTIANGFDAELIAALPEQYEPGSKLRLVHTGSLAASREGISVDGLLRALRALRETRPAILQDLEVVLVGTMTAQEMSQITAADLHMIISVHPPVAYEQALQLQVQADVLLLVLPRWAKGIFPGKLFEYLASRRPILALTLPDSLAAGLLRQDPTSTIVAPDDVGGIQAALEHLHQHWRAGTLPQRNPAFFAPFDRQQLTGNLSAIFDRLIATSAGKMPPKQREH